MENQERKILIITYYWPPAGGPGVQRWLKFAKYLPQFGWKPVIYTPENPSFPLIDNSLLKEIPKETEIVKTKILEPYSLAERLNKNNKKFKSGQFDIGKNQSWKSKLSIWIRGNFFIPDARILWVRPSVKFLKKYLRENHIETLVTTGPPHSLHLIGLHLKKENPHLRWIADFRDPWTDISYYQHLKLSNHSDKKHRQLEKAVFKTADITLATSYTDAKNFRNKGANSICITNGFDTEIEIPEEKNSREKFVLSYVGVLEQLRNPEILWQVLEELIHENKEFKEKLEIRFVGRIDDKILETLEKSSLKTAINNLGYLSHQESIHQMQDSSLLLITNFPQDSSKGILPGKIFEYLASGNPILSFGPKDADVQKILEETEAGKHFTYEDKQGLKSFLSEEFQIFSKQRSINVSSEVARFSRKNLTSQLSEVLNRLD